MNRKTEKKVKKILIIEGAVKGKPNYPTLVIPKDEEERLQKPWKKTLIVKLLGKSISFKTLE